MLEKSSEGPMDNKDHKKRYYKTDQEYRIEAMITKSRLSSVGHVFRKATSMESKIMLGMIGNTRRRGRPRTKWMDGVKEAVGMKIRQIKKKGERSGSLEKSDYGSNRESHAARCNLMMMK